MQAKKNSNFSKTKISTQINDVRTRKLDSSTDETSRNKIEEEPVAKKLMLSAPGNTNTGISTKSLPLTKTTKLIKNIGLDKNIVKNKTTAIIAPNIDFVENNNKNELKNANNMTIDDDNIVTNILNNNTDLSTSSSQPSSSQPPQPSSSSMQTLKSNVQKKFNITEVLTLAERQYSSFDFDIILERYVDSLSKFIACIERFATINETPEKIKYTNILNEFNRIVCNMYNVNPKLVYIKLDFVNIWGNIFWNYLHYTSILLQNATFNGLSDENLFNFPLLVYNINEILPCSECLAHYLSIKQTQPVLNCLKTISFGYVVNGIFEFHNLINVNIRKFDPTSDKTFFGSNKFYRQYNCLLYENLLTNTISTETFQVAPIELQTKLHIILSELLRISSKCRSMFIASNRLKHLYKTSNEHNHRNERNLYKTYNINMINALDETMTDDQVIETLDKYINNEIVFKINDEHEVELKTYIDNLINELSDELKHLN